MTGYRQILSETLAERQRSNKKYSMRAFAKDLGVSPTFYSLMQKGERSLSESRALEMADRLGFDETKRSLFAKLTRLETISNTREQDKLKREVEVLDGSEEEEPLSLDVFQAVSNWHHGAIVALMGTEDAKSDPRWMARRLNISPMEAEVACDRLVRLGILKRDGDKLVKSMPRFRMDDHPDKALRKFHKQTLGMARDRIDQLPPEDRQYEGVTMAANPEQIAEARAKIKRCLQEIRETMQAGKKSAVFHASLGLFRIDKE